jgi:adenine-specific DNA-methyltransferase
MSIVAEPFVHSLREVTRPELPLDRHIHRQLHTAADRTLWHHLRDCRFGGAKFRRQHLVGLYLADFVCMEARLVIELSGQRSPTLDAHAEARRAFFHANGYQVLCLRDRDVLVETRAVLGVLRQALKIAA